MDNATPLNQGQQLGTMVTNVKFFSYMFSFLLACMLMCSHWQSVYWRYIVLKLCRGHLNTIETSVLLPEKHQKLSNQPLLFRDLLVHQRVIRNPCIVHSMQIAFDCVASSSHLRPPSHVFIMWFQPAIECLHHRSHSCRNTSGSSYWGHFVFCPHLGVRTAGSPAISYMTSVRIVYFTPLVSFDPS